MYEQYLRDPASVGEEWRQLFDNGKLAELPVIPTNRSEVIGSGEQGAVPSAAPTGTAPRSLLPASPGLTPITGPAARLVQNMTERLSVPTATPFPDITVHVPDGGPPGLGRPGHQARRGDGLRDVPRHVRDTGR